MKNKAKPLNVAERQPHWIKADVAYKLAYHLSAGFPLCTYLLDKGVASRLYFARYTSSPCRVEIRMITDRTMHEIRKAILTFSLDNVRAKSVSFEEIQQGSVAHAVAFELVAELVRSQKLRPEMLRDVLHWTYNMAGFSYAQEAYCALIEAASALRGMGLSEEPAFSVRPKNKKRSKTL